MQEERNPVNHDNQYIRSLIIPEYCTSHKHYTRAASAGCAERLADTSRILSLWRSWKYRSDISNIHHCFLVEKVVLRIGLTCECHQQEGSHFKDVPAYLPWIFILTPSSVATMYLMPLGDLEDITCPAQLAKAAVGLNSEAQPHMPALSQPSRRAYPAFRALH